MYTFLSLFSILNLTLIIFCKMSVIIYSKIPQKVHTYVCCILAYVYTYNAKQKQPGCKKSARPIRSHKYKRPKTLISSKAKKLNILLRIFLLE